MRDLLRVTEPGTDGTGTVAQVVPLATGPLRQVVAVLCFTEVVSWGVLFYAFPVLVTSISRAEGWSLNVLIGVFTGAQVAAAGCGVWVGRHIDRHGPRRVMTGGSMLAVVAVVLVGLAPTLPLFAAAWLLAGTAMSATLYTPAFAAVTYWATPTQRVRALTAVTLVAGFASTVFAPLAALLLHLTDWRTTYLLLSITLAATILAHWWGLNHPWHLNHRQQEPSDRTQHKGEPTPPTNARTLPEFNFVLLTVAFTLAGFCVYAVVINLVPLLTERGLTTGQAAIALGVGGAGQVAGRLLYTPVFARLPITSRTATVLGTASVTTVLLALTAGSFVAACGASFAAGTARGIFTLIQATAVTDRWGTRSYGRRTAILSGGVMTASAFAPWVGSILASITGGYATAFACLAAGAALSALLTTSEGRTTSLRLRHNR